jgi:hypothetical protein
MAEFDLTDDFGQISRGSCLKGPPAEPCERCFNDLSAWDHDEAGGADDATDDDQRQAEQDGDPVSTTAGPHRFGYAASNDSGERVADVAVATVTSR